MAYLALVRHGQSEWNALGLWTGLRDIELNDIGIEEARQAAESLRGITFDVAYTSALVRAQQTLAAGLVEALGAALDRCDALERERDALIVALAKTQKGQAQQ